MHIPKIYIKGSDCHTPHARGAQLQVLRRVVGKYFQMSSGGSLQLPQAQRNAVDSQQKPISLPFAGADSKDEKSAVKNSSSSVPAPITEQTLSSLHGIVPTLQWVSS